MRIYNLGTVHTKERTSVFENMGLVAVDQGRAVPGENWGECSEAFGRENLDLMRDEQALATLGHLVGKAAIEPMIIRDEYSFGKTIKLFAATAHPPLKDNELPVFEESAFSAFHQYEEERSSSVRSERMQAADLLAS